MDTSSNPHPNAQDKKAAHRASNEFAKIADQFAKGVEKEAKDLKHQNELERKNAALYRMLKIMRDNGASNGALQKAHPGLAEFLKYVFRAENNPNASHPENPQASPSHFEVALGQFLSDIEAQEVRWLWEKRIPLGKLTLLDGDPGMGKSLLAINLAARVSTGQPMPDGTPGQQGSVILIAPEDGAGDTLRPRLEAAGGDPSRVLLLNIVEGLDVRKRKIGDRPFTLSRDLDALEEAIKRTRAVLVVLDPLMAVLGYKTDATRDQAVREILTPLAQLAERTNCAILIIRHLSKGLSRNALYRGSGSIGIIAAARTGLIVAQHPEQEHKRILATTKNNLSKPASNLTYQVVENASHAPYIQWLEENNYTLPTLLDSTTNLSIEHHKILQVLQDADGPLTLQHIAELTGQKYTSTKLTLSRMHKAKEIIRRYRGMYTTPDHPSLLRKSTTAETTETNDTSDTNDTNDTIDTLETTAKFVPYYVGVR